MTISTTTSRIDYAGDGVTTALPVPFTFFAASELRVIARTIATGVEAVLTISTDYTVAGGNGGPGTVAMSAAPATTVQISILRNTARTQLVDYVENDPFPAETHERALDRVVAIVQEIERDAERAVRIAETDSEAATLPTAVARANTYLAFDALGSPIASPGAAGAFPVSTWAATLLDDTSAAAARATLGVAAVATAEAYGAAGDGVADDRAALVAALAASPIVRLRDGAIYLISSRIDVPARGGFVCDGTATIRAKTGSGGFNVVDLDTTAKNANNACMLRWNAVDGGLLMGVTFDTDGGTPVVLNPVRVEGGMSTRPFIAARIGFTGFAISRGGLLSLNSVGNGAYACRDISAWSCGTALTTWTGSGSPQITVFEVDNDLVAGVHSQPGYAENIRARDVAFSGAALAAYGAQTDVVGIAGIGTNRKGPTIHGVYGDNVGELVDLFCTGAIVRGVRGRNVYNFGVKLIHGASGNLVEVDVIESVGIAAVAISGSAATANDTEWNTVRVGQVRAVGTIGSPSDFAAVMFLEPGSATGHARNNTVIVDNVTNAGQYVVRSNLGGISGGNRVVVNGNVGAYSVAATEADPLDVRVIFMMDDTRARLVMGGNQTIAAATPTAVAFDTVQFDSLGEADATNKRVRCKTPGNKLINASVRILSGFTTGTEATISITKGGATVASDARILGSAVNYTLKVSAMSRVDEDEAGTSAADYAVEITVGAGGGPVIGSAAALSYFEVVGVST